MKKWVKVGLMSMIVFGLHSNSHAQFVIAMDVEDVQDDKVISRGIQILYKDKNKTRIDVLTTSGSTQSKYIIRDDLGVMWMINDELKTCMEMPINPKDDQKNKETLLNRDNKYIDALPEELKSAWKGSVFEDKQQKEAQSVESEIKVAFKKVSTGHKVKNWTCDKYDGYINNKKFGTWCYVKKDVLGIKNITSELKEAFSSFGSNTKDNSSENGSLSFSFDMPHDMFYVQGEIYLDNNSRMKSTLRKITLQKIDPKTFQVPNGYQKTDMMSLMGSPLFDIKE